MIGWRRTRHMAAAGFPPPWDPVAGIGRKWRYVRRNRREKDFAGCGEEYTRVCFVMVYGLGRSPICWINYQPVAEERPDHSGRNPLSSVAQKNSTFLASHSASVF